MASYVVSISSITLITICILSSVLLPPSAAAATVHQEDPAARPFNKIYAFGDSFTDTGNTKNAEGPSGFGHVSNSPYGTTFFNHSTNRYCDGRLVIDFVTESLSLPYLQPYRHSKKSNDSTFGVNFAVAGSTAINHMFFVMNNLSLDITPQSIQTQMLWFNRYLESQKCKGVESKCKDFDDTLFWFGEIGVNDYAYTLGSSVSGDTIRKLAISTVSGALQVINNIYSQHKKQFKLKFKIKNITSKHRIILSPCESMKSKMNELYCFITFFVHIVSRMHDFSPYKFNCSN